MIIKCELAITSISRLARVVTRSKDEYGRLVVIGIISLFSVQFLWNMAMTLGLVPLAAFSLPFISYGGSQLIMQMAAVGLVLSVYRRKDMVGLTVLEAPSANRK
ncbi:MAG: FtsW/RodA/SpoVE family cell cycle protein [Syntrophomonadaceae bacterium]|nr:FtsW/RodA/SpoVE family cell cycle protein [Syntrophomonadaceae bacterium]